jgi:hypothetical protein
MPRDDNVAEAGTDLRAGSRSGSPTANQNSLRGFVERMVDDKLAGPNPVYTKHDPDALTERENIWRARGMPEETQAFAAMLFRNHVAPEQVLFDAGCTDYADDRAHLAIAHAAETLLREGYESTDDDRCLILVHDADDYEDAQCPPLPSLFPFFFCSLWERTGTFYVEGC